MKDALMKTERVVLLCCVWHFSVFIR